MKKTLTVVLLALAFTGCKQQPKATAELYLYADNKIEQYYGFITKELKLTECEYNYPSSLRLSLKEMEMRQRIADNAEGIMTDAECKAELQRLYDESAKIVDQWHKDIPDTTEKRLMFLCQADNGIVFHLLLDKDNKTPVCTTMDIDSLFAVITGIKNSLSY